MKTIHLVTTNLGKVKEFQEALKLYSIKALTNIECEETGSTFEQNALLKATHSRGFVSGLILTEDSGLEVDYLGQKPGVHSKRYSKEESDLGNNLKLLKDLENIPPAQRSAQFRCVICLFTNEDKSHFFEGSVKGYISEKLHPGEGFGYDSCFIPEGETQTFSKLGLTYKSQASHRARALKKLVDFLAYYPL